MRLNDDFSFLRNDANGRSSFSFSHEICLVFKKHTVYVEERNYGKRRVFPCPSSFFSPWPRGMRKSAVERWMGSSLEFSPVLEKKSRSQRKGRKYVWVKVLLSHRFEDQSPHCTGFTFLVHFPNISTKCRQGLPREVSAAEVNINMFHKYIWQKFIWAFCYTFFLRGKLIVVLFVAWRAFAFSASQAHLDISPQHTVHVNLRQIFLPLPPTQE